MTIKLNSITKNFGELVVISNVTLEVRDGELFVLLGGSGSGKSTILRIIAGLVNPDSGAIFLNGRDATDWAPQRRGCGMVFQHYAIFKHMNVGENVEFGLRVRNVPSAERRRRRDEMLELVGLSGLAGRMPLQLSGGQRQRVALARALAFEPSVLLLDEPFGALDVKIRSQLRSMLRKVQSELGVTTILVTHDQEEAFELGDRIGILERGQLVEVGDPQALYHGPATETAATFLGSGNLVVGRIEGGKIRMGKLLLPFPAGGPAHEEGGPVRVLFRPEAIEISDKEFSSQEAVVS
ncbi:MAG: ABC transporter ATP-binding protein, partial [Deltaproteobacteria bacterium]|nr:ABC transporter ATP-binding protein [Deltaproteobacteria bacterium]